MIPEKLRNLKINEIFKINGEKFKVEKLVEDLDTNYMAIILDYSLERVKDGKKFNLQVPEDNFEELLVLIEFSDSETSKHIKKLKFEFN